MNFADLERRGIAARIREMFEEGWGIPQIADETHIAWNTIRAIVGDCGPIQIGSRLKSRHVSVTSAVPLSDEAIVRLKLDNGIVDGWLLAQLGIFARRRGLAWTNASPAQ